MKTHFFLINDDKEEMLLFAGALKSIGIDHKCTWATSGEQALDQLTYLTPDFIFVNYSLPGMNGIECLKKIKQLSHLEEVPVILHGSSHRKHYSEAITAGALNFIDKPADLHDLVTTLSRQPDFLPSSGLVMA